MLQEQTMKPTRGGEMITPSGLQPVFPDKVRCPEIASPFGSQTRYDGSPRPSWAPGGATMVVLTSRWPKEPLFWPWQQARW